MKIESMWCVRDPGAESELCDILWLASPEELCRWAFGTPGEAIGRDFTSLSVYAEEAEAREDAEKRIAARDARAAAAPATGSLRVWEFFGGNVRQYESGDVRHWDDGRSRWAVGWGDWSSVEMSPEDWARSEEADAAAEAYQRRPPVG